jgi:hypothetical protein
LLMGLSLLDHLLDTADLRPRYVGSGEQMTTALNSSIYKK